MEKLIELLLECKPQIHYLDKPKGVYNKKYGIGWYKRKGDIGGWFSEEVAISKKFGFIKWLVDNDKIDQTVIDGNFGYFCMEGFDTVDSLLMVLAISDSPIDFLCEIIKK